MVEVGNRQTIPSGGGQLHVLWWRPVARAVVAVSGTCCGGTDEKR